MAGRQCGSCTLCCKVMGVGALKKPLGAWCPHCLPGKGCAIYPGRPQECRSFMCRWLVDPLLGEDWYPRKSKIVLTHEPGRIVAHIDPSFPEVWRREPYFGALHQMMHAGLAQGRAVYVAINRHHILLLPDRQEDLGLLSESDEVVLEIVGKPAGMEYRVSVRRGGQDAGS